MRTIPAHQLPEQGEALLNDLKQEKATLLTDADGRPTAYLIDSVTFESLQSRLRLLEGIARGERAIEEGRVLTQAQAKRKMARWLRKS